MRVLLAVLLLSAVAVAEDKPATFKEVKASAEGGDKDAQFRLGEWYSVTMQDFTEAAKWWLKAAEQGDVKAQGRLSVLYVFGEGVPENVVEAVKWTHKAAEQGDAKAQHTLGVMYAKGGGVPKDDSEAAKWYHKARKSYRKAAEQGDADAHLMLGKIYSNGLGVPENDAEAVKWFRKAAEQGNAKAQNWLGVMYYRGKGVPADYAEAVKWFRKAAEQGLADAHLMLGLMYYAGKGIPRDAAEAYAWWSVAATNGNEYVIKDLTELKAKLTPEQLIAAEKLAAALAKRSTSKDDAEALRWVRETAEQGYIPAQRKLGLIYADGKGVPEDDIEAYAWYSVAAVNGNEKAKEELSKARAKLTTEQLAEGQKRASELFQQINANKVD
jgi:TPR repeat protein